MFIIKPLWSPSTLTERYCQVLQSFNVVIINISLDRTNHIQIHVFRVDPHVPCSAIIVDLREEHPPLSFPPLPLPPLLTPVLLRLCDLSICHWRFRLLT